MACRNFNKSILKFSYTFFLIRSTGMKVCNYLDFQDSCVSSDIVLVVLICMRYPCFKLKLFELAEKKKKVQVSSEPGMVRSEQHWGEGELYGERR